jgi:hypothetical protein
MVSAEGYKQRPPSLSVPMPADISPPHPSIQGMCRPFHSPPSFVQYPLFPFLIIISPKFRRFSWKMPSVAIATKYRADWLQIFCFVKFIFVCVLYRISPHSFSFLAIKNK